MSPAVEVAIETSERPGSLAVRLANRRAERTLAESRAHARDLLPLLAELLDELGLDATAARELGAVYVGLGPGSYTGLRVGLATAQGLARGAECPLRGVPSFEALSLGELAPGEHAHVVRDARAGRFYHAAYRRTEDDVEVHSAPRALRLEELQAALEEPGRRFLDAGSAEALGAAPGPGLARAGDLLTLGARRLESLGPQDPAGLEPLYLRAFGE